MEYGLGGGALGYKGKSGFETFRTWVSQNVAPVTFLGFYFLTIVAGNIMYATSIGAEMLSVTGFPTVALEFETSFTLGFWILLLLPFAAVPVGLFLLRRPMNWVVSRVVRTFPDFRQIDYLVLAAIFYGIAFWALLRTDAFSLAGSADKAVAAVEARFILQERMYFPEKVVIHSILPFLSFYSIVAAILKGGRFWWVAAAVNLVLMSVFLMAVNMKWPILVFYIGVTAAVFIFSARYAYLKAILGGVLLVAMYLGVSTYVFRAVTPTPSRVEIAEQKPEAPIQSSDPTQKQPATTSQPSETAITTIPPLTIEEQLKGDADYLAALAQSSVRFAPLLFAHAVNRMAIAYPYYYHVFTTEGTVCGGLLDQAQTHEYVKCRPSWLIYTRIFGHDGFEGRGTAPAAAHIYGYALGGWPVAIAGVVGICLVLAAFSALPLNGGLMTGALIVVGTTVGYHLSQIPGEGPVFYDHGFIWPLLLVMIYSLFRHFFRRNSSHEGKESDGHAALRPGK